MANIEQSIKVGNGFALKAPSPVDLKTTAATIAERDSPTFLRGLVIPV